MELKDYVMHKVRALVGMEEMLGLMREVHALQKGQHSSTLFLQLIEDSGEVGVLPCVMNGLSCHLPTSLLRMYTHCLHPVLEPRFIFYVETQQSDWVCARLSPGDTALDVGASGGIISLAMAGKVAPGGRVFAFEPAQRAGAILQQVIGLNKAQSIQHVRCAVSDAPGRATFIEYGLSDELNYNPEKSALAATPHSAVQLQDATETHYDVDVTTLDAFVAEHALTVKVIKIDIEGFELKALYGARTLLATQHPALCIDIHPDPEDGQDLTARVSAFLDEFGYRSSKADHTLYAEA